MLDKYQTVHGSMWSKQGKNNLLSSSGSNGSSILLVLQIIWPLNAVSHLLDKQMYTSLFNKYRNTY